MLSFMKDKSLLGRRTLMDITRKIADPLDAKLIGRLERCAD